MNNSAVRKIEEILRSVMDALPSDDQMEDDFLYDDCFRKICVVDSLRRRISPFDEEKPEYKPNHFADLEN